jgi:hypothetical protein
MTVLKPEYRSSTGELCSDGLFAEGNVAYAFFESNEKLRDL